MSIILDAEVSGFSELSEKEQVQPAKNKMKSVVRVVNEDEKIKYILASDGQIGEEGKITKIKYLCKPGGSLNEVASMALQYMDTLPNHVQPLLMISAGHTDIDPEYADINSKTISKDGSEERLEEDINMKFRRELQTLKEIVQERGGILAVTSIIPCPRTQCFMKGINRRNQRIQRLLSRLYVSLNNYIFGFNRSDGVFTPNIKSVVEVSRISGGLYKYREQKVIVSSKFEQNLKTPRKDTQKRLMKMVEDGLVNLKKNLGKTKTTSKT